jgi:hypothetical protein
MLLWAVRQILAQIRALTPDEELAIRADLQDEIAKLLEDPLPTLPPVQNLLAAFGKEPTQKTVAALNKLGCVRISSPEQAPHYVGRTDRVTLKLAVNGEDCVISTYRPPARFPVSTALVVQGSDGEAFDIGPLPTAGQTEPTNVVSTEAGAAKAATAGPKEQPVIEGAGMGTQADQTAPKAESVPSEPEPGSRQTAGGPTAEPFEQATNGVPLRLTPVRVPRPSPVTLLRIHAPLGRSSDREEPRNLVGGADPSELMPADGAEGS